MPKSLANQIRNLIKNHVVIRHRNGEELPGGEVCCMLCNRALVLPPGSLCLVIDNDGPLCPVCGAMYAPDMLEVLKKQLPSVDTPKGASGTTLQTDSLVSKRLRLALDELAILSEKTDILAKSMARGIIEAPAGHIGLMHYAKDIQKPERRNGEVEKDYDLRVRSFRIARLYENIKEDMVGRVEKVKALLERLLS